MRRLTLAWAVALLLGGVCGGQPPKPPAPADAPQVFTGKVVPLPSPQGKPGAKAEDRGLALLGDDGTSHPLIEDDGSKMLFMDSQLRNRPVRLTAVPERGTKKLRVVSVQTVKDGKVYDVDYWCEICQISLLQPGKCYCCGDETVRRERPAK